MKRWGWVLVVCGAVVTAAGHPPAVRAELLHFAFRGHVYFVTSDGPLTPPAILPGDAFTGSFSYDPNSPLAPVTPSPPTFFSPGQVTLQLGGWDFRSDTTRPIYLSLNAVLPPHGDWFSVTGQVPDPGLFSPPAMSSGFLGLFFFNQPGHASSGTPPARLDLSELDGAMLALTYPSRTGDFALPSFSLSGGINELTTEDLVGAPEPGTLALGLLGVLASGCLLVIRAFRAATVAGRARLLMAVILALVSSPAFAGPLVFDAASQFSMDRNPSGPWGYGWSAALGSPFQPFALHYNLTGLGLDFWNAPADPAGFTDAASAAGVLHNATDHTIAMLNSIWSPGRLGLQPGFHGEYSIVRWTAPADGRVAVRATFTGSCAANFAFPCEQAYNAL